MSYQHTKDISITYFGDTIDYIKNLLSMEGKEILKYILCVIVILKPVNVTFKILFQAIKPVDNDFSGPPLPSQVNNVGKLVGDLERLLVLSFMIIGEYSAIGIIFAGKSITRYKKIEDDPEFAEYYLLGTFFSILSTIIVYNAIRLIT